MLKITRADTQDNVFRLSGRMETEDILEVKTLFSSQSDCRPTVLDLEDLTLVDQDAVIFLRGCEAESIELENCPPYIRKWIDTEIGASNRQKR
jgi:hypothetical protein